MRDHEQMKILEEPLFHFILIGAALFFAWEWRSDSASAPGGLPGDSTAQVIVTVDDIDRMNSLFAKTWQRPPTEAEQKALLEDFIRNEIFYREALAIGLDRDDEVLKRRLRQKMEFIYEEISALAEPTDEELRSFMEKNRETYLLDPRTAFRHVYVNATRRGTDADSHAQELLARLSEGADHDALGDSTLLETEVPLSPIRDVRTQFGPEFAEQLLDIEPGKWAGPIRSAYGLHLVFVIRRVDRRLPDWEEARETVRRDWIARKQKELKDAAYARIRDRYAVTVEKPKPFSEQASAAADKLETTR